jgi:hypothetical protein
MDPVLRAIFVLLCCALGVSACKTGESPSPALATSASDAGRSVTADAARPNCRPIDGSARVECDDDPKGVHPRVQDCTWEWADDPCPEKSGVDPKRPEPMKRPPTVVK